MDEDRLKRHELSDEGWARLEPSPPRHPRPAPAALGAPAHTGQPIAHALTRDLAGIAA